ncbi:MAG: glycosyltransferase family 9 protein [Candidatus Acidiferrum sp.]|jgi:ADP-heptose:LPS heptosyltransferase
MADPRFLVVRLGSLGDIVHTFPAVSALRQSFPASRITWLTHPRWESLVASSGLATEIWATETRSVASIREILACIRKGKFAVAIDYQGLWKSAALPLFGGIPRRIGFSSETIREWGVPILYSDRVRCVTTHIAEQNGELSRCAGAKCIVAPFALQSSAELGAIVDRLLRDSGVERYVLLSPGGGWRSKCWPPERFGQLAHRIRESLGLRCVVNYGPGEDYLLEAIKASSGNAEPIGYSGSVERLMALSRGAEFIVGGDTGPLHLAIALGTPSVSIYGPTDPQRNGPYPTFTPPDCAGAEQVAKRLASAKVTTVRECARNIVLRAPSAVRNHSRIDETDSAILKISVQEVFAAVSELIGTRA